MTTGLKGMFLAGAAALLAAGAAYAQPLPTSPRFQIAAADPFSSLVGDKREKKEHRHRTPDVERFSVAADGRIFVVEGGVGEARIKFLCADGDPRLDCRIDPEAPAEEIFLVTGERGPRGDVIYKDAQGEVMLRITSYGGATVFWPGERQGQAASRSFGDDGKLALPEADFHAAQRRAQFATAALSAVTGEPIVFDIGPAPISAPLAAPVAARLVDVAPAAEAQPAPEAPRADVLADAVARVAAGMRLVANDPTGARILAARVKSVRFEVGDAPGLSLEETVLRVVYNPLTGVRGRPASSDVSHFLEETL